MYMRNTYVQSIWICTWEIHMYSPYGTNTCTWEIHTYIRNTYVHKKYIVHYICNYVHYVWTCTNTCTYVCRNKQLYMQIFMVYTWIIEFACSIVNSWWWALINPCINSYEHKVFILYVTSIYVLYIIFCIIMLFNDLKIRL